MFVQTRLCIVIEYVLLLILLAMSYLLNTIICRMIPTIFITSITIIFTFIINITPNTINQLSIPLTFPT